MTTLTADTDALRERAFARQQARRRLLKLAAFAPLAGTLGGCTIWNDLFPNETPTQIIASIAADALQAAEVVGEALPYIEQLLNLVAPGAGTVLSWVPIAVGYINDAIQALTAITTAISTTTGAGLVNQAIAVFTALLNSLTGVSGIPADVLATIQNIFTVAGNLINSVASALGIGAATPVATMTVDAARAAGAELLRARDVPPAGLNENQLNRRELLMHR